MARIIKKPLAEADLLDIWNFIANDSFEKADRLLHKIDSQLKILVLNPGMGRKRDSLALNLRSFPVGNYLNGKFLSTVINTSNSISAKRKSSPSLMPAQPICGTVFTLCADNCFASLRSIHSSSKIFTLCNQL